MAYTAARREIDNLLSSIQRNEGKLSSAATTFWSNGGTCCPDCGCLGYSELSAKVVRQRERVEQLRAKIAMHECLWSADFDRDRSADYLLTYFRGILSANELKFDSAPWDWRKGGFDYRGSLIAKRFRIVAKVQKTLRRIAPTHPLAHLDTYGDRHLTVPVFHSKPLPELPLFGEDP